MSSHPPASRHAAFFGMGATAAAWFQWQSLEMEGILGLACALGQAPTGAEAAAGIKHLERESGLVCFPWGGIQRDLSAHPSALPGLWGFIPVRVRQLGFVALNLGVGV